MSFETMPLAPTTRAALKSMGISQPTPIQARALPILFAGRDLIAQARTGSGKTLAFVLPMVEKLVPAAKVVQALVLVPTRELAQQVADVVDSLVNGRSIRCVRIFGGRAFGPQVADLRRGPHIVVGTPGRVLDLLGQKELHLNNLTYLVLDEADEMLDRGFAPDVERILSFAPSTRQTALFSATVPEWVNGTAQNYLRDPELVRIDPAPEDRPKIDHVIYDVPEGQKLPALRSLLDRRNRESVLVFGRTKHGVKKLAKQLVALDYPVAALQGNLSQNARDTVMADFRARRVPILLATNVAARGLDVEHIGLVVNYELPETAELLTHRVGRTGRMGREGDAVTLLAPSDEPKWRQLARTMKIRIPRKPWDGDLAPIPSEIETIPLYPERKKAHIQAEVIAPGGVGRTSGQVPSAKPRSSSLEPTGSGTQGRLPHVTRPSGRKEPLPNAAHLLVANQAPTDRGWDGRIRLQAPAKQQQQQQQQHAPNFQPDRDRFGRPLVRPSGGSFRETLKRLEQEDAETGHNDTSANSTSDSAHAASHESPKAAAMARQGHHRSRRDPAPMSRQRRSA